MWFKKSPDITCYFKISEIKGCATYLKSLPSWSYIYTFFELLWSLWHLLGHLKLLKKTWKHLIFSKTGNKLRTGKINLAYIWCAIYCLEVLGNTCHSSFQQQGHVHEMCHKKTLIWCRSLYISMKLAINAMPGCMFVTNTDICKLNMFTAGVSEQF